MTSELLVVNSGATRTLILNRPEKRNAMNNPMLAAMARELDVAAEDDSVRTIVLTGAGDYFCIAEDSDMRALLYAGDQLNHLLTLNGQLEPLFTEAPRGHP